MSRNRSTTGSGRSATNRSDLPPTSAAPSDAIVAPAVDASARIAANAAERTLARRAAARENLDRWSIALGAGDPDAVDRLVRQGRSDRNDGLFDEASYLPDLADLADPAGPAGFVDGSSYWSRSPDPGP